MRAGETERLANAGRKDTVSPHIVVDSRYPRSRHDWDLDSAPSFIDPDGHDDDSPARQITPAAPLTSLQNLSSERDAHRSLWEPRLRFEWPCRRDAHACPILDDLNVRHSQ